MEREKKRMPQKKWLGMRIVWRQWVSALVTRLQVKSLQQVTGILQFWNEKKKDIHFLQLATVCRDWMHEKLICSKKDIFRQ